MIIDNNINIYLYPNANPPLTVYLIKQIYLIHKLIAKIKTLLKKLSFVIKYCSNSRF